MSEDRFVFEKALARLETIATAIEQGKIGLEESISQFEEGMTLIKKCRAFLTEAEMKIQRLEAVGDSDVAVKPLDLGASQ